MAEQRTLTRRERKKAYRCYLASEHWRNIRDEVLVRDRWACQDCKATKYLAVHHLTYERLGHERLSDLETLCRSCHYQRHFEGFDEPPKRMFTPLREWWLAQTFDPADYLPSRSQPDWRTEDAVTRRSRLAQERQEREELKAERFVSDGDLRELHGGGQLLA